MPVQPELDTGSYLAHYGVRNPWTQWLLRVAPELAALPPSVLTSRDVRPLCPDPWCRSPMHPRPEGWACYRHDTPQRRKYRLDVQLLRWAPNQPSALSLVGKDVDLAWDADQDGYVIIVKGAAASGRPCHQQASAPPAAPD